MRYGFIGLGNLGGHLAASLLREGFSVCVTDIDPTLGERHVAMGATFVATPQEVASQSDAVFTCLPSPAVSEMVLHKMLETANSSKDSPGMDWIEMSTLGRDDILRLGAVAAAHNVRLMESPVTGGVHLAAQGKITVLAGGDLDLFDKHHAALQAMGNKILHMGPLGSAAVIKVITNMLAFIHLVADGEALMLAKRGGLDLAKSWEAITASSGTSFVHETEGQLILNGSYDIAFSMDLALKDLGFAMGFGREFGVPLDLAGLTQQTFMRGKAAYGGAAQSTQIVKLLEDVLQTNLRADGFPSRLE